MSVTPFPDRQPSRFVDDLLGYMTLTEKLGQLSLDRKAEDPAIEAKVAAAEVGGVIGTTNGRSLQALAVEHSRLGIPLLIMASPRPSYSAWALAATWDVEAAESCGFELGSEARETGANTLSAPRLALADEAIADQAGAPVYAHLAGSQPHLLAQLGLSLSRGVGHIAPGSSRSKMGTIGAIVSENGDHRHTRCSTELLTGPITGIDGKTAVTGASFAGIDAAECRRIFDLVSRVYATTTSANLESAAQRAIAFDLIGMEEIDRAVRGVLTAKYRLGLFRDPFGAGGPVVGMPALSSAELTRRTMVLLRNEGGILPFSAVSDRVLVVGSLDGAGARCAEAMQRTGVDFMAAPGLALRRPGESWSEPSPDDHLALALTRDAAERADFVLLALEDRHFVRREHERWARPSAALIALVKALSRTTARLVALVATAEPVDLGEADRSFSAALQCWEPAHGFEEALGRILSGREGPEGRMPATVGHFPMGHGLGFGECTMSGFRLETGADHVAAVARLRNTGAFAMKETVQIYIRGENDELRLVAFERVSLRPEEEVDVRIELGAAAFATVDMVGRLEIPRGRREILLGKSLSRLLPAEITITDPLARALMGGRPRTLHAFG